MTTTATLPRPKVNAGDTVTVTLKEREAHVTSDGLEWVFDAKGNCIYLSAADKVEVVKRNIPEPKTKGTIVDVEGARYLKEHGGKWRYLSAWNDGSLYAWAEVIGGTDPEKVKILTAAAPAKVVVKVRDLSSSQMYQRTSGYYLEAKGMARALELSSNNGIAVSLKPAEAVQLAHDILAYYKA